MILPRLNQLPWITLTVAAAALLWAQYPDAIVWVELDRNAFLQAQLWRVWTGHLVHYDHAHLLWDLAVLLLLGSLLESGLAGLTPVGRRTFGQVLAASGATISVAVLIFQPHLTRYRGLSGIDSTLFAWLAASLLQQAWTERHRLLIILSGLALFGFMAKCIVETTTGRTIFVDSVNAGFVPVPLAHLVGAGVGLLAAALHDDPITSIARAH